MNDPRLSGRALNNPEQMFHAFTKETTEVWCTFAERIANTNFDGHTHFCQFCGSTEHESLVQSEDNSTSHDFQRSRIAGTITCQKCNLLPLDDEDTNSPCPGKVEECQNCGRGPIEGDLCVNCNNVQI